MSWMANPVDRWNDPTPPQRLAKISMEAAPWSTSNYWFCGVWSYWLTTFWSSVSSIYGPSGCSLEVSTIHSNTKDWHSQYSSFALPSRPTWFAFCSSRFIGCSSQPAPTSGSSMFGTQKKAFAYQQYSCGFFLSTLKLQFGWKNSKPTWTWSIFLFTWISVDHLLPTVLGILWWH